MKNLKTFSSALAMLICSLSFAQEKIKTEKINHKKLLIMKNLKPIFMNVENQLPEGFLEKENQLLEKFQVEELEKRYEFAWIDEVVIGPSESGATF